MCRWQRLLQRYLISQYQKIKFFTLRSETPPNNLIQLDFSGVCTVLSTCYSGATLLKGCMWNPLLKWKIIGN